MSEPDGLNLSLDDLIARSNKGSRGRGRGRGDRSSAPSLNTVKGGVSKVKSPGGHQKFDGGRGRGGFANRGGFVQGGRGRGNFDNQKGQQQNGGNYGNYQNNAGRGGFRGGFQGGRGRGGQFNQQQSQRYDGYQGGRGRGPTPFQQRARPPTRDLSGMSIDDKPQQSPVEVDVWHDETTGNVVATLKETNIVTVGPDGTILLDTGGWFTSTTLSAMNEVLAYLQMKVTVTGEVSDGRNWSVADNMLSMKRFNGQSIVLPPKGVMPNLRRELLYNAYHDPEAYLRTTQTLALQAAATARAPTATAVTGLAAAGTGAGGYGASMSSLQGGSTWTNPLLAAQLAGGGAAAATGTVAGTSGVFGSGAGTSAFGGAGAGAGAGTSAMDTTDQADVMRRIRAQGRLAYGM